MIETGVGIMDIHDFLVREYLDSIFKHTNKEVASLSQFVQKIAKNSMLSVGDHLVTPRLGYTHHGIYAGNKQVIHYSGLSKGLSSGPVQEISLEEFESGRGYKIKPNSHRAFDGKESVERARGRMHERKYHLAFNNCEHFVNWCIHNRGSSSQVSGVTKVAAQHMAKRIPHMNAGITLVELGELTKSYLLGDITKEHFFDKASESIVSTTSIAYYSVLGQASIPIPVVGALVGASVGYMVGNILNQSGLIAIGDTLAVKQAKKRRQDIQAMCEYLLPEIRKSKRQLQDYLDHHFNERKELISKQFENIDLALHHWDSDAFVQALEAIGGQFLKELELLNFKEFSEEMESDRLLSF